MNKKIFRDLFSRKSFIISLIILLFFTVIAGAANILTPYKNPYSSTDWYVSGPYSVPAWARVFPQYSNYPMDLSLNLSSPSISGNGKVSFNGSFYNIVISQNQYVNLSYVLLWNYSYPYSFTISSTALPKTSQGVEINVFLVNSSGYKFFLTSYVPYSYEFLVNHPTQTLNLNQLNHLTVNTLSLSSLNSPYVKSLPQNEQVLSASILPSILLPHPGKYHIIISVVNLGTSKASIILSNPTFSDLGRAYGILGTDDNGASVFAEFVLGARFDLELSLLATLLIVGIGLVIGLVAGYAGSRTDLILNAFTDFFLTIPGLPLIIALETILLVSGAATKISKVVLILLIIAGLSWMGTMKIIRSVTLSLKNRTFIEASKALGGGSFHIIFRHILPNLLGVVFAQIAYDVPTVILIESGLDFLGLGITSFPTWGNMLGKASGLTSSANGFVWWWVLPPGIAIVLLSVAFYYIGTALQDVLSPYKLRGE